MKRLKLGFQSNFFNTRSQKYLLRATSLRYCLQLHTLNQYQGLSVAIIDPHKVLKMLKLVQFEVLDFLAKSVEKDQNLK